MRIVWHESGFAGIDAEVIRFISKLGDRVADMARRLAPVDTGALVASIEKEMAGKTAIISANTDYAVYQELGTGPHVIEGNPTLSWPGLSHPVESVDHPGNPAIHYLRTALYSIGGG